MKLDAARAPFRRALAKALYDQVAAPEGIAALDFGGVFNRGGGQSARRARRPSRPSGITP